MTNLELKRELAKIKKLPKSDLPLIDGIIMFKNGVIWAGMDAVYSFNFPNIIGKGMVDVANLYKILSKLDNKGIITLKGVDGVVTIQTKDGDFIFKNGELDEGFSFHEVPEIPDEAVEVVKGFSEVKKLEIAARFVSQDQYRLAINSIYLGNSVWNGIAATDGHMLYFYKYMAKLKREDNILVDTLVPVVLKGQTFDIYRTEKRIYYKYANVLFSHRIYDYNFPNVKAVIPDNPFKATLDVKDAIKKVNLALIQVSDSPYKITINFGTLDIVARNTVKGSEYKATITGQKGEDIEISFNAKFLLTILKECNDTMDFYYDSPSIAVIIDNNFLIMPIYIDPDL